MPRTGIEHAYGLYDRTANYIEDSNPSNLNKKIFLTTFNEHYLGCNKDGDFYIVKDFQNENVNQSDLEWQIVSLEENVISLMSSHLKYLTVSANHCVNNSGTEINASTKWKIKRVDNSIYLQSVLFPKMNLIYIYDKSNNVNSNYLEEVYLETGIWNLVDANPSVKELDFINEYNGSELISEKRHISKFIRGKKIKKLIDAELFILRQLRHQIRGRLNTIKQTIDSNFQNSLPTYRSLSGKYLDDLNKLDTYRRQLTISNVPDTQTYMLNDSISK